MALPAIRSTSEKISYYGLRVFVGPVLVFLIAPILAIMPLSFNSETFFSYPMPGYSTKWYVGEAGFFYQRPLDGGVKTFGHRSRCYYYAVDMSWHFCSPRPFAVKIPGRAAIMAVLISPMIVPVIISAIGLFFFMRMSD